MPTSTICGFPPRLHPLKKERSQFLMPLPPQFLCGPVRQGPGLPSRDTDLLGLDQRLTPKEQTEQEVQWARFAFSFPVLFWFF